MKRVFLDINVLLDLIDSRRLGHPAGLRLQALMVEKNLTGLLALHSLSVIEYIGRKRFGSAGIQELISGLIESFSIPKTGSAEARVALNYASGDFEDAMQIASAITGHADFLVTRDTVGFRRSPVKVVTPEELVALLGD